MSDQQKHNYIDAHFDRSKDEVVVWERTDKGRRIKRYPAPYYFYVPTKGEAEFTSIAGDKLVKLEFDSRQEFDQAVRQYRVKFESDISPLEKTLMKKYYGVDAPKLHYSFLDIEVDYKKELGFSSPENPYAPVNAITIYNQWQDHYFCIAVPPPNWPKKDWKILLTLKLPDNFSIQLVDNEKQLLQETLRLLDDSDVISGWNSDFFDLPYLIKRTEMTLGRSHARMWSFYEAPYPKFEEVEKFGRKSLVARIYGRNHFDYLQLFKKFTFEGRASFALANIADEELPDFPKLEYDGTLEDLYTRDFNYFIRYNIRDVEIIVQLDNKFRFIDLANELAHANTVTLDAVMGSVKIIDTGIINFCHNKLNLIVFDREQKHGDPIEGALVMNPQIGMHEWIGSVDINSLYPSTYRSLNISPEKIIGQFADDERDWASIRDKDDQLHTLEFEDGSYSEYTGAEWYEILKESKWAISAFGTVFDQANGMGLIPGILADWYANRKRLQGLKKDWGASARDINKLGIEIGDLDL